MSKIPFLPGNSLIVEPVSLNSLFKNELSQCETHFIQCNFLPTDMQSKFQLVLLLQTIPIQKQEYKKSQTLHYQNGYALKLGSTKVPTEEELVKLMHTNIAKMTFGDKQYHVKPKAMTVVPSFIAYDKTVECSILKFTLDDCQLTFLQHSSNTLLVTDPLFRCLSQGKVCPQKSQNLLLSRR